jgi:hypothetical protein
MVIDIKIFIGVFCIAILACGNTMYVIAKNHDDERFTGSFVMSIIYAYRMGIGDFDTADFEGDSKALIYLFFIITTLLILIVLLNMLIAIMGDTFDRVIETA